MISSIFSEFFVDWVLSEKEREINKKTMMKKETDSETHPMIPRGWLAFFFLLALPIAFRCIKFIACFYDTISNRKKRILFVRRQIVLFTSFYTLVLLVFFSFSSCFGLQQKSNLYLIYTSTFFAFLPSIASLFSLFRSFSLMIFMIFPKLTCDPVSHSRLLKLFSLLYGHL